MLVTAAMSASRHNPVLRAFYHRLLQAGKPNMVGLIALARKLLIALWRMVTFGEVPHGVVLRHAA